MFYKDTPALSKEGGPQSGKNEKQTTILGMGDPAPAGKVVDFTITRDGATKDNPPKKAAAPDKDKQADKSKDTANPRRGHPPKTDKAAPDKAKSQPRDKMSQSRRATPGYEVVGLPRSILPDNQLFFHLYN